MFCKKGVLRNFAKFTGKHLCQRLFFNKVAGLAHLEPLTNFKQNHMEVGNITEAASFKSLPHLSHKNTKLLFCVTVLLAHSKTIY